MWRFQIGNGQNGETRSFPLRAVDGADGLMAIGREEGVETEADPLCDDIAAALAGVTSCYLATHSAVFRLRKREHLDPHEEEIAGRSFLPVLSVATTTAMPVRLLRSLSDGSAFLHFYRPV